MRTLVAVGTARLACMLATIREAAPRRMVACSSPASVTWAGAGAAAAGTAAWAWAAGTGAGTGAGR